MLDACLQADGCSELTLPLAAATSAFRSGFSDDPAQDRTGSNYTRNPRGLSPANSRRLQPQLQRRSRRDPNDISSWSSFVFPLFPSLFSLPVPRQESDPASLASHSLITVRDWIHQDAPLRPAGHATAHPGDPPVASDQNDLEDVRAFGSIHARTILLAPRRRALTCPCSYTSSTCRGWRQLIAQHGARMDKCFDGRGRSPSRDADFW